MRCSAFSMLVFVTIDQCCDGRVIEGWVMQGITLNLLKRDDLTKLLNALSDKRGAFNN
jgi:hypothetical protein